jgi:excisionase family DNA binding protein
MLTQRRNSSPKPLLSVEETAILLGETRSTLYRAVKAGTLPLPVFRIGSRFRIPRVAVERLIAGLAHPAGSALPLEPPRAEGQPAAASSAGP